MNNPRLPEQFTLKAMISACKSVGVFCLSPKTPVDGSPSRARGPSSGRAGKGAALESCGCRGSRLGGGSTLEMSLWELIDCVPYPSRSYAVEYGPRPAVAGVGSERIWPSGRRYLAVPEHRREGAMQDDQGRLPEAHPELQR